MQNNLEFAENLARNLHHNLAQIRLRKLNHHLRTMGYTGALPVTLTIPNPSPTPDAPIRRKNTQPHPS